MHIGIKTEKIMCRKDIAGIMNKINEAIGQDLKTTVLKKKLKGKPWMCREETKKKSQRNSKLCLTQEALEWVIKGLISTGDFMASTYYKTL